MRASLILAFILVFFSSCSELGNRGHYENRNLGEYYASTGVVKYFLPDLPAWANSSTSGACSRDFPLRYFDISKLISSYSLNYEQSVQFQLMFNFEAYMIMESTKAKFIPFRDEEKLFFDVADRIQSNFRVFKVPTYKRIHIIWVDYLLQGKEEDIQKFKKWMASDEMSKGHPVLLSLCRSRQELRQFLGEKGIDRGDYRYITFELLSPFDKNGERSILPTLNINGLLGEEKEVYFFTPSERPVDLIGNFKVIKF